MGSILNVRKLANIFLKIWAFPGLFLEFIFLLGSLSILQFTITFGNGDRKIGKKKEEYACLLFIIL